MNVAKILKEMPDPRKFDGYAVYFLEMDDGSQWVWKPDVSGAMLKEVIAYKMSEWLGLNIVPETVSLEWRGVVGSLQKFVQGALGTDFYRVNGVPSYLSSQKLALFDYIMNNNDRWHVNVIIEDTGRIWAIDNAGILQERDAWSASAWAITGRVLESEIRDAVIKARMDITSFVKHIFSVQAQGIDGPMYGTEFRTGVHIACEKIASLASAVNIDQIAFDTWGSINFFEIAEQAGYPE